VSCLFIKQKQVNPNEMIFSTSLTAFNILPLIYCFLATPKGTKVLGLTFNLNFIKIE
jgi:hypothetical protein